MNSVFILTYPFLNYFLRDSLFYLYTINKQTNQKLRVSKYFGFTPPLQNLTEKEGNCFTDFFN